MTAGPSRRIVLTACALAIVAGLSLGRALAQRYENPHLMRPPASSRSAGGIRAMAGPYNQTGICTPAVTFGAPTINPNINNGQVSIPFTLYCNGTNGSPCNIAVETQLWRYDPITGLFDIPLQSMCTPNALNCGDHGSSASSANQVNGFNAGMYLLSSQVYPGGCPHGAGLIGSLNYIFTVQ